MTYQAGSELVFFHVNLLDPTGMDVFTSSPLPLALNEETGLFLDADEPGVR